MDAAGVVVGVVGAVVVRIVGVVPVTGVEVPGGGFVAGVPGTSGVFMVSWNVEQDVECTVGPGVQVVSVTLGGGN